MAKRKATEADLVFVQHLSELKGPLYWKLEYCFCPTRKWRFDAAFPDHMLAVEIEGSVWTNGRHTRGSGFVKDIEKYNFATLLGWRLLRFTPQDVLNGKAIAFIKKVLES